MCYLSPPPRHSKVKRAKGFSLAEVLITVLILGEIAVFTIPKVISSQQSTAYNAIAKESIATFSAALEIARNNGTLTTATTLLDLTPYINYVYIDTSTPIDDWQTSTSWGCDSTIRCLVLHNGARVALGNAPFGTTSGIRIIQVDPDGVYGGTTNGPGKAVPFYLYYNGRVTTHPTSAYIPPWFSW